MRSGMAGFATVLFLTSCGSSPPPHSAPAVVSVETTRVVRQPIAEVVHAAGDLYPLEEVTVSPQVSAPVRKFFVKRGDIVHTGELLATLENRDLMAAATSAEGAFDKAQSNYAAVMADTVPEQLQTAELNLRNAKAKLDAQQKLYDSSLWLYQQHALARKQLDQAAVALTNANSEYLTAEKRLNDYRATGAKEQIRSAKGELEAARGQYLSAKAQVQYTEIRSPMNGVISNLSVFSGGIANAGTPLITVMDVSSVVARLHVPQSEAAMLRLGNPAVIDVPGLNRSVLAKVTVYSPALDPQSTTVEIWVSAPTPYHQLQPGTSVSVAITARVAPKALVVPSSSILKDANGAKSVMIVRNGRAYRQRVATGIVEAGKTQIVSGLFAGEEIIATGAYGLPDGTKVITTPSDAGMTADSGNGGE